jgi:uncharacterized protein (TIGR00369 family)
MTKKTEEDRETEGFGKENPHFGAMLGLEKIESAEDASIFELKLRPEHCNQYGSVHGGVLMSLLDAAGLWAGAYRNGALSSASTAALNCNFLCGARWGEVVGLRATGEVTKRGKSMYFSSTRVHASPSGDLLATGQGVYSSAPGQAAPREDALSGKGRE